MRLDSLNIWQRIALGALVGVVIGLVSVAVRAQDSLPATPQNQAILQENCSPVYETITPLRNPSFDSLYLWRRVVGRNGYDWFTDYVPLDDGQFFAIGMATPDMHEANAPRFITLLRYDKDGQVLEEQKKIEIEGLESIVKAQRIDQALYLGVNIKKAAGGYEPRLLKMSFDGAILKTLIFREDDTKLKLTDMVLDKNGVFIVSLQATKTRNDADGDAASVSYSVNTDLKKSGRRLYMPGTPNMFNSVSVNKDGSLLAAGRVQVSNTGDGRDGGWLVNLDEKGSIYWQKSFSRGAKAELVKAADYAEQGFVALGTAWRSLRDGGEKNSALWLLLVDTDGRPKWQRFVTGGDAYSFSAVDMQVLEDKRVMVLVNATALTPSEKVRSHIRMLMFSPQGTILDDKAYVEGSDSKAHRLTLTPEGQLRIVGDLYTGYGASDRADAINKKEEMSDVEDVKERREMSALEEILSTKLEDGHEDVFPELDQSASVITSTMRAWLLAIAPVGDYKNPCTP